MKPAYVASLTNEPVAPLPAAVAEIGKIHFEGNIIPHPWYQRITFESGKPDMPAIIILAEIVYWYRPYQTLDKHGRPLLRKHFDGDMFQCTAAYFETKFGITKDQARKALKRLEDAGYIRREYRSIVQQGILRNNIMFIEPVPLAILAITHPAVAEEAPSQAAPPSPVGDTLSPVGDTLSPVGDIFKGIEITTKTTTEITTTTPNPSSTNSRAAEPESARGGGQDEKIKDQPTDQKDADPDDREPELSYPAKLTEQEREDIAAQVYPLPAEVAQQMLDVIESGIKSSQIRTNPAAMLRGIVRKYRADPGSFDPSSGFHVADQRRRRAEAEARLRRAAETQRIGSAKMAACILPVPRQQTEGRRRFVDTAMKALQGE